MRIAHNSTSSQFVDLEARVDNDENEDGDEDEDEYGVPSII